ncbi:hypothetical protein PUN28_019619 [Cardiocondyla obscurior]|uniref:Uncharacterized protein n=1 Tax=Cardiocondyla obscurior TaxID=286306 RepID=A0AAW2EAX3_9HYME
MKMPDSNFLCSILSEVKKVVQLRPKENRWSGALGKKKAEGNGAPYALYSPRSRLWVFFFFPSFSLIKSLLPRVYAHSNIFFKINLPTIQSRQEKIVKKRSEVFSHSLMNYINRFLFAERIQNLYIIFLNQELTDDRRSSFPRRRGSPFSHRSNKPSRSLGIWG